MYAAAHMGLYATPSRTAMNQSGAAFAAAIAGGTAAASGAAVTADPSAPLSAYSASGVLSPPASNNTGVPYGLALSVRAASAAAAARPHV